MEFSDREILLRRITTKKLYATVKLSGNTLDVLFTDPSLDILLEADWIYKKHYQSNVGNPDFLTQKDALNILKDDNRWSDAKDSEILGLRKDIEKMQEKLPFLKFHKIQQRQISQSIAKAENRIKELEKEKNQLYHLTLEFFCNQAKRRFLISKITKFLSDFDFNVNNTHILDILSVYYFEENSISMKDIRELARTDPWRLYWTASKDSNISLFPHSSVEMSDWQYLLVLWSRIYDYAFANSNPPPESILQDDNQFDAWYKAQASGQQVDINPMLGDGMQEVFIPADEEGAKEIFEMNTPEGKARVQNINKIVKEKGQIDEVYLPDTQRNLKMALNRMKNPMNA